MEAGLRARLEALSPAARAELLHVLMLPNFDRVERIGEFWGHPETREFGELLIDLGGGTGPRGRSCSGCWRRWSGGKRQRREALPAGARLTQRRAPSRTESGRRCS
jgi:hypothetical protein